MEAVIKKVTPKTSVVKRLNVIINELLSNLRKSINDLGVVAEVMVAGSLAKNTWLTGAHDIDLFIKFINEDDISVMPSIVKSCFKNALAVKGTRTYYSFNYKGYSFELVPVLKLERPEQAQNSMDASPFHVNYVKTRLNPKMINEVRLLKQFCKAQGVYGAESYVGGFSGYVVELLIIHFKTFNKLIDFFSSCRPKVFIDIENYYPSAFKALSALGSSKTQGPLVIIDPVLFLRNAAAGVSKEAFSKFILASRLYKRRPENSFFKVIERTIDSVKALCKRRGHFLITKKFKVDARKDVFFSKLLRKTAKIAVAFKLYGFLVYDYGLLPDGTIYFELNSASLPPSYRALGPYVWHTSKGFYDFIEKHKDNLNGPYIINSRVCFDLKRKYVNAKELFDYLLTIN